MTGSICAKILITISLLYICLAQDDEKKVIKIKIRDRTKFHNRVWNDVYLKRRPKSNFIGHPSKTCWNRGGICLHIELCNTPEMSFEGLINGCTQNQQVCCKVWNQRIMEIMPAIRMGADEQADTEKQDVRELLEKGLRNFQQMQSMQLADQSDEINVE